MTVTHSLYIYIYIYTACVRAVHCNVSAAVSQRSFWYISTRLVTPEADTRARKHSSPRARAPYKSICTHPGCRKRPSDCSRWLSTDTRQYDQWPSWSLNTLAKTLMGFFLNVRKSPPWTEFSLLFMFVVFYLDRASTQFECPSKKSSYSFLADERFLQPGHRACKRGQHKFGWLLISVRIAGHFGYNCLRDLLRICNI